MIDQSALAAYLLQFTIIREISVSLGVLGVNSTTYLKFVRASYIERGNWENICLDLVFGNLDNG